MGWQSIKTANLQDRLIYDAVRQPNLAKTKGQVPRGIRALPEEASSLLSRDDISL